MQENSHLFSPSAQSLKFFLGEPLSRQELPPELRGAIERANQKLIDMGLESIQPITHTSLNLGALGQHRIIRYTNSKKNSSWQVLSALNETKKCKLEAWSIQRDNELRALAAEWFVGRNAGHLKDDQSNYEMNQVSEDNPVSTEADMTELDKLEGDFAIVKDILTADKVEYDLPYWLYLNNKWGAPYDKNKTTDSTMEDVEWEQILRLEHKLCVGREAQNTAQLAPNAAMVNCNNWMEKDKDLKHQTENIDSIPLGYGTSLAFKRLEHVLIDPTINARERALIACQLQSLLNKCKLE